MYYDANTEDGIIIFITNSGLFIDFSFPCKLLVKISKAELQKKLIYITVVF